MSIRANSKQGIVILIGAVGLAGILIWLAAKKSDAEQNGLVTPTLLTATMLAQDACSDGRIIRAMEGGREVASYNCTSQDAAVAFIAIRDKENHPAPQPVSISLKANDETGKLYPLFIKQINGISLYRIPVGFGKRPASLSVKVTVGVSPKTMKAALKEFKLTKIAEPVRQLTRPSEAEIAKAERYIKIYRLPNGGIDFRLANPDLYRPENGAERTVIKPVCMTYCPPGPEQPDFFEEFASDLDLVKFRVQKYEVSEKTETVVYRNATVVSVNGIRQLILPNIQKVGLVNGQEATVYPQNRVGKTPPELFVRITPGEMPSYFDQSPRASFAWLSPTIEQMGMKGLEVRIGSYMNGVSLVAKGEPVPKPISVIPELKIGVRVQTPRLISSEDFIAAVRKGTPPPENRTRAQAAEVQAKNSPLSTWFPLRVRPNPGWAEVGAGSR